MTAPVLALPTARAGHEQSPQAASAVPVTIANAAALHGDRYSPNLRKWVAKELRRWAFPLGVYCDLEGQKWIGWIDDDMWFIGARLRRVLCEGTKAEVGCWTFPVSDLTELPDFPARYAAIGRCAIDEAHTTWFIGGESRWAVDGDVRRCLWCGDHEQHLRHWTETVERERWEPAQAIEARRTATGTGAVHESAVGETDAPNPSQHTPENRHDR